MARKRILVSWIGHADLRGMSEALPQRQQAELAKVIGEIKGKPGAGPIRTLLDRESFDEVHLLTNYGPRWIKEFRKWLGQNAVSDLHDVGLSSDEVTDYAVVFEAADTHLSRILNGRRPGEYELCLHLSPGTPAMAAVWVLLGKTRYPATFFQTHDGRAWTTDIPFEIALDFVPELLRAPDAHLQHLAAKAPGEVEGFRNITGDSKAIRVAVGLAERAAMHDVPVLILGESGTGKELFARAIHSVSHRRDKPFIPINCAAIPKELLESELFGHAKGAFTGAVTDKAGAFERADGGTLFLDEIGECDPAMQAKLLRVLQPPAGEGPCTRSIMPVGGTKEKTLDVRIVSATNKDLGAAVADGEFREDLYYRIAVITLPLPPLRDRPSDIPKIAQYLLQQINEEFGKVVPNYEDKSLSDGAKGFVRQYDWPGNVRQLYNALLQAATLADGPKLSRADLQAAVGTIPTRIESTAANHPLGNGFDLEKHLAEIQRSYLTKAMQEANGVKTKAAKLLGLKNYQTLDAQLKRLKVKWK